MATCKDCLHVDACVCWVENFSSLPDDEFRKLRADNCGNFKDKTKYIEQKHSQWDKNGYCSCGFWTCYCGDYDYCPKCGAKMDLKENK